jgi:predicted metal-binding protein
MKKSFFIKVDRGMLRSLFICLWCRSTEEDEAEMSEKMDKQHLKELKEMIQEKKTEEPVEQVLVKFCARHGVSLDTCRIHYRRLVEKGEIKEK